jgi:hypothetical protein
VAREPQKTKQNVLYVWLCGYVETGCLVVEIELVAFRGRDFLNPSNVEFYDIFFSHFAALRTMSMLSSNLPIPVLQLSHV